MSSFNQHLLEKMQIVPAVMPVNLATAANTGDWVSLKEYGRCGIVFICGVGTSGQDPTITVLQAKTVAGSSSKALNFTRVDYKEATALTSVGQFTTALQAAADTFTIAGSATLQKVWVIDIKDEDLDIDNGFDCLQASINDVGTNSQIGVVLYLLHEPRDQSKTLPSAIID